jgi:hypothetical protein
VVVLFIDQDFKIVLYPTQAAADSNTGAIWTVDNVDPFAGYALPANLNAINALTPTDGNVIVGNGTTWIVESGNTARTSLGLGTSDSPTFAGVTAAGAVQGASLVVTGLTAGHVMLANAASAVTALNMTAKGSLMVGDGAGAPVAVAVGTNNHVLTADSAQASGVKWAVSPSIIFVQQVNSQTGATATGTTVIPFDDTIPQNTEGDQYLSLAITPTSATNALVIDVVLVVEASIANNVTVALFVDSTANALAAVANRESATLNPRTVSFRHRMIAGSTSAMTFKVRAGGASAGTTRINGFNAGQLYGGVCASSITITEVTV